MTLVDPGDFTPPYDAALAHGLAASGAEVRLIGHVGFAGEITPSFREEHFYRLSGRALRRGMPDVVARLLKGLEHGFDMNRLAHELRRSAVDIVHFQWLPLPLMDHRHVRRIGAFAPTVITVHDSLPYNGAGSLVMQLGHERLLHAADALIVHTEEGRERLHAGGHAADRVHVVPHGMLQPTVDRAGRHEPITTDRPLQLLQFGKIKPYKGIDVLLEAIGGLTPDVRARLHVRIVGKPYMDIGPLHELIVRHGLTHTIKFRLDFVPEAEMNALFAAADAVVCPYRTIDASGVAMTAMAQGLPLVASRIGMFAELFGDGKAALLVPAAEPGPLADVLARLSAEPGLLESLRRGMLAKRAAVPSWDRIAELTMAVYDRAYAHWRASR